MLPYCSEALCVMDTPGSGSSKRLAKKDAALAMLQYISDGGEISVSRLSIDGNQDLGQQLSEVNNAIYRNAVTFMKEFMKFIKVTFMKMGRTTCFLK